MLAEVYQAMGQKKKRSRPTTASSRSTRTILSFISRWPITTAAMAKEKSVVELKKAFNNPELGIETKISILSSYYALIELYPELREQAMEMTELLVKTTRAIPRLRRPRRFPDPGKKYEEARVVTARHRNSARRSSPSSARSSSSTCSCRLGRHDPRQRGRR